MMKKILLGLYVSVFSVFNVTAQVNLDSGLVAHYPFNGNALDVSGLGNHGTVNGALLTNDRFMNENSAYSFDGIDDEIKIEDYQNMSPTDAVSIVAWVKTESAVGAPPIYDRLETNDGYGLRLDNSGNLRLTINGGIEDAISDREVNDGDWHCVIGTYDRFLGELNVYIDGQWWGNDYYSSTITYNPEPRNSIGAVGGSVPVYFNGLIDDVRVYNRAINTQEIYDLCGVKGNPTFVEEIEDENQIRLYPNPTESFIEFKNESSKLPKNFSVVSVTGQMYSIEAVKSQNVYKFNIENLPVGVYSFRVLWDDDSVSIEMFIVQ